MADAICAFIYSSHTLRIAAKPIDQATAGWPGRHRDLIDHRQAHDVGIPGTQYPTIHFVSTRVEQTAPNKALITGNLTFHGVTKPVLLAASFNAAGINPLTKGYTAGFDATATINRSAWLQAKIIFFPAICEDILQD